MPRFRELCEIYERMSGNLSFLEFNKKLAIELWQAFKQSVDTNKREEHIVQQFVNITNGKHVNGISLHSKFIHGKESQVKFYSPFKDRPRELGDSLIITILKEKQEILLSKTCFIQHKKAESQKRGSSWKIQKDQLFLLKNFPPFSGVSGIFANEKDLILRNDSGCLGAYGLFGKDGNMIFMAAPLITELLRGRDSISDKDISLIPTSAPSPFLGFPFCDCPEAEYFFRQRGWPFHRVVAQGGYLNNTLFCRDLFDFTSNWLRCNIGEVTYSFGQIISSELHGITKWAIRQLDLSNTINFKETENDQDNRSFEGGKDGVAISAAVIDVSKRE